MTADLTPTWSEGAKWTELAEEGWEALVLTGMNLRVPYKAANFSTISATIGFLSC
jgi:hypothetical protein